MHTFESLTADLKNLGIDRGDTLLIHSSMKSIGEVEGRADTVLDVFMEYLGDHGLLVMPALTWSNVNSEQPVFDVRNTPSVVGILPELFRQRPGVLRSLHPTHSLAAFGREAEAFLEGHERFDTPVPDNSPWRRLIGFKAKILFLGADIAHNTFLHGVEEWGHAEAVYSDTHQQLEIVDYDGRRIPRPMRRHTGGHSAYYGKMGPIFRKIGASYDGVFGDAGCVVMDAVKVARITMDMLKKYPAAFTNEWNGEHPDFFTEFAATV